MSAFREQLKTFHMEGGDRVHVYRLGNEQYTYEICDENDIVWLKSPRYFTTYEEAERQAAQMFVILPE